jgi:hypothetical protein
MDRYEQIWTYMDILRIKLIVYIVYDSREQHGRRTTKR